MKQISIALGVALLTACAALSQNAAPSAGFEVVSIKPSDPGTQGSRMGASPNGDYNAKGATLKGLIQQAYELRDFQVTGGSAWIETERYDLIAKGSGLGLTEEELRKMTEDQRNAFKAQLLLKLQALLADRFQLKVHKETKEMPIYGLAIAKSGVKIQTAVDDGKFGGGISMSRGETGKSEATFKKTPMSSLTKFLSGQVGRTVLDQTGLKGEYDFKLTFAPDLAEVTDGPSIFTAVQDQLGLRLDAQKGPVEVLVVDGAQKASGN